MLHYPESRPMKTCWAQYLLWGVIAALGLLSILATAGCGQKGDLYLPDREPPAQSQPADR